MLDELKRLVGTEGPAQVARHPVNEPMIAHWCDAMGLRSPAHLDPDHAGGNIAPAEMLDVWNRLGLGYPRPAGPRADALTTLEAHGFTSVVAVNSEIEVRRYVRPGEWLHGVEILDGISDEKATGLGIGHFVTTRHRYTTRDGEHVGDLLFRILKFKPGTGKTAPVDPAARPAPDADPAKRPRPAINRDNRFFWDGARAHELRIQRCAGCGMLHGVPTVRCQCGSMDMEWQVASGRGTLYSFAVPHFPQVAGFRYPLLVGLVELAEGPRLVANLVGVARDQLRIGMPLDLCWLDSHPALEDEMWDSRGSVSLPQFRPAAPEPTTVTRAIDDVRAGDELPLLAIPVTPTLIVSGALASRDFQQVHHDRDVAVAAGSKDIFMNINTTMGLTARYVTDWAGPGLRWRALRIRLGVPNYPGDTLTYSGGVTAVDGAVVTVAVRGHNSLGDHVTGTLELELPR